MFSRLCLLLLLLLLGPALAAGPGAAPPPDWPAEAAGVRAAAGELLLRVAEAARRAVALTPGQAQAAAARARAALAEAKGDHSALADKIRQAIREGLPEIGLLPLDPMDIGDLPLGLNIPGTIALAGRATGLRLTGLAEFEASADFKVRLFPRLRLDVYLDMLVPSLDLVGEYGLRGNAAGVLDVWGDGDLRVSLVGARVLANVSVGLRGLGARADDSSLHLDLERVDVNLTGLFEPQEGEPSDGELSRVVSEIIGELLTDVLLDGLKQAAGTEAQHIALDALNRVLATMTVADLSSSFSQLSAMSSRKALG